MSDTALTGPDKPALAATYGLETSYRPALADGIETLIQALGLTARQAYGAAASLWFRYLGWRMRRATRVALRSLDARSLQDIGMDRSEIEAFVRDLEYRPARF
jgi:uncharacterized protein YjiS (DUF1127 family)